MARKGGSKSLKRFAAPPVMQVSSVKERKFVTRPEPGPHSLKMSIPLQVLVRDILKMAETGREAKYVISHSMVLVDGVVRTSHKFPVGLMDVVSVRELGKHFRILVNEKGELIPVEIPQEEASMKICRINKKYLYRGRLRLATEDGRSFETEDWSLNVGGSLLVKIPEGTVLDKAPLCEGVIGYVFMGKHTGAVGTVRKVSESSLLRESTVTLSVADGSEISTVKDYVMVVGRDKPWLKLF
ncbi:MAG: 30S ribosomal protein S4e [Thaumarchaeota archaeon]|jgi:small subunit ribosomal protein S4e|nr:30S ribosomal protein S4e [Nitrososphaerota archaeon]